MKLLLDENISYRVANKLKSDYSKLSHVKFNNLSKTDDKQIWNFAKKEGYTIVTNDSDFNDMSLIFGFPPKVIWLRTGNTSTKHIADLLRKEKEQIINFVNDTENGILIFE